MLNFGLVSSNEDYKLINEPWEGLMYRNHSGG